MSGSTMWGSIGNVPITDANWPVPTRQPNNDLDRTAFLQLLITQLQHQDPLNPMDDRDFIAQMAQFSALEQMVNLNATFERSMAYGMIGKFIDASFLHPTSDGGEWIELQDALVVSVSRQGDTTLLTVVGEGGMPIDVPMNAVRIVTGSSNNHLIEGIWNQMNMQRAQAMVGQYIQAVIQNDDRLEFIEGKVTAVKLDGMSRAVLMVGTREVFPHEVTSVSDRPLLIGSTRFTHGGPPTGDGPHDQWTFGAIIGVEIEGTDRAFLRFENGARYRIDRINQATEAIQFVGSPIRYGGVSGIVRSVTLIGAIPFLNVYNTSNVRVGQIDMIAYKAARIEGGGTPAGFTPPPPVTTPDPDPADPTDPDPDD